MFKNFYEKYIEMNLKDYGFKFDFDINKLIIVIFIGLCAACFFVYYNQSSMALALKKLIRAEAFGEGQGKTLAELGLTSSKPIKRILSKVSGPMSKLVSYVGARKMTYEEFMSLKKKKKTKKNQLQKVDENKSDVEETDNSTVPVSTLSTDEASEASMTESSSLNSCDVYNIDFSTAKFYIYENMKDEALRAYNKNNSSLLKTILYCVLLLGFTIAVILLMPLILKAVSGIISL